jgi:hypothetical protein
MRFLFNGQLTPLTNSFGFVKCDFDQAVSIYRSWLEKMETKFTQTHLDGDFKSALQMLPPFQFYTKSLLFRTDSEWVGYTNNNFFDAEIGKVDYIARQLKSETVHLKAYPKTIHLDAKGWSLGSFSHQDFSTDSFRIIMLSYQDRWELYQVGDPFPFEQVSKYKERKVADRFTPEMLDQYGKAMGIRFFDESFYLGGAGNLVLFSRERPLYENEVPSSLEEERKKYTID